MLLDQELTTTPDYSLILWTSVSVLLDSSRNERQGTNSTRTRTRTTTAQKITFLVCSSFTVRSLGFRFSALNFVNRKMIECFSMKLNKCWESFCCYVLVVPKTLKKVFSPANCSDKGCVYMIPDRVSIRNNLAPVSPFPLL